MIRAYILSTLIGVGLMSIVLINGMEKLNQSDVNRIAGLLHTDYVSSYNTNFAAMPGVIKPGTVTY